MKPRQPRVATLIAARLNSDSGWSDVIIKNMSANGAMLQSASPPRRGTYVELRKGASVIVGRTIWSDAQHCGIQTQDRVQLDQWLSLPAGGAAAAWPNGERRLIRRQTPAAAAIDARAFGVLFESFAVSIAIMFVSALGIAAAYHRILPALTLLRVNL
jgi:hypothetical protein